MYLTTRTFALAGPLDTNAIIDSFRTLPEVKMFDVPYKFVMHENEAEDPIARENDGKTLTIPVWVHGIQIAHPDVADETMLGKCWVLSGFDDADIEAEQRMEVVIHLHADYGIIIFNPDDEHPEIKDKF